MAVTLARAQALAYRAAVQGLGRPGDDVLAAGAQDYPPGRTARLAVRRARERSAAPGAGMNGASSC